MTISNREFILSNENYHVAELTRFGLSGVEAKRVISFTTAEIEAGIKTMEAFDNDRARNMIKACNRELEIRG